MDDSRLATELSARRVGQVLPETIEEAEELAASIERACSRKRATASATSPSRSTATACC